jgi:hypothetical protein
MAHTASHSRCKHISKGGNKMYTEKELDKLSLVWVYDYTLNYGLSEKERKAKLVYDYLHENYPHVFTEGI